MNEANFTAYVLGQLNDVERATVEARQHDEEAARSMHETAQLSRLLRSHRAADQAVERSSALLPAIQARIAGSYVEVASVSPPSFWRGVLMPTALAASVLLNVVAMSYWLTRQGHDERIVERRTTESPNVAASAVRPEFKLTPPSGIVISRPASDIVPTEVATPVDDEIVKAMDVDILTLRKQFGPNARIVTGLVGQSLFDADKIRWKLPERTWSGNEVLLSYGDQTGTLPIAWVKPDESIQIDAIAESNRAEMLSADELPFSSSRKSSALDDTPSITGEPRVSLRFLDSTYSPYSVIINGGSTIRVIQPSEAGGASSTICAGTIGYYGGLGPCAGSPVSEKNASLLGTTATLGGAISAGTVTLTGDNSYSGGTTISAGTLLTTTNAAAPTDLQRYAIEFNTTAGSTLSLSSGTIVTKHGAGTTSISAASNFAGSDHKQARSVRHSTGGVILSPDTRNFGWAVSPSESRPENAFGGQGQGFRRDALDAMTPAIVPAQTNLAFTVARPAEAESRTGSFYYLPSSAEALQVRQLDREDPRTKAIVAQQIYPLMVEEQRLLSESFGEDHPKVKVVRKQIQVLQDLVLGGKRAPGTESYDVIFENPFHKVIDAPLSTFSIDVDTASYSNVRRFLKQGRLPPADAVRLEEFINYFTYDYPQPTSAQPFSVTTEVAQCPWNTKHRLVRIGLKGREVAVEDRPASNLVFLLDVSGSMQPENKLPLVKQGMRMLTRQLSERDRVAIVVYAGASGLVLPSTTGNEKETIINALAQLNAGGSTNGASGLQLAYNVAAEHMIRGGINRVILCTDGDFNVGVTSQDELVRMIEEKAKTGVQLSVLGFGMDNYKDSTLEKLADKGDGNYAYIDTESEARKVLVDQLSSTLITIAKDVKIQIEFNPARVANYRLLGYENRIMAAEDFNNDKKDAGEIGAGHTVTALYEVTLEGAQDSSPGVDPLKYQRRAAVDAGDTSDELLTLKLRYKLPGEETSKLIETPVGDETRNVAAASKDLKFSSAVAAFGMLLRHSKHAGTATLDSVLELGVDGRGSDLDGYREEFLDLVRRAKELKR